jgi:integrase
MAEADVQRLIALEPEERNRVLLTIVYVAGLRVSEACGLRWRHLRARGEAGQILVHGKGGRTRAVMLPAAVWPAHRTAWRGGRRIVKEASTSVQRDQTLRNAIQNNRSIRVSLGRERLRFRTATCWRKARISRAKSVRHTKKTRTAVTRSRMNRSMNLTLYHTAKPLIPWLGRVLATQVPILEGVSRNSGDPFVGRLHHPPE